MPSFSTLSLCIVALASLLQLPGSLPVAASPVPMPLLLASRAHTATPASTSNIAYAKAMTRVKAHAVKKPDSTTSNSKSHMHMSRYHHSDKADIESTADVTFDEEARASGDGDFLDSIASLNSYYNTALGHSNNLQSYAAQSSTSQANDPNFNQDCLSELNGYYGALGSFQSALQGLGADKGLADYDRQNDLETLLKNVVNLHKYTLESVDCLVAQIPLIGPLLAPTLYEIKCILDLVLDAVENLTDAIINYIQPLLQGCIGSTVTSTCSTGVSFLDICL